MKTINLSDAALARLTTINKHAAGQRLFAGITNHTSSDCGSRVSATAHVTGSDFDSRSSAIRNALTTFTRA